MNELCFRILWKKIKIPRVTSEIRSVLKVDTCVAMLKQKIIETITISDLLKKVWRSNKAKQIHVIAVKISGRMYPTSKANCVQPVSTMTIDNNRTVRLIPLKNNPKKRYRR